MGLLRHSLAALGAAAVLPFAALGLALRPTWRVGLRERLGDVPASPLRGVWVHAASVGEARAAQALIAALSARSDGPRAQFVSASTVAGREISRAALPELPVALAPLDHPWCVAAALSRVRPSVLVMLETEVWPQWIAAATRRGIPVVIVSGRLSDRSLPRYERLGPLFRPTLRRISAVGARSEEDAARFVALGVRADCVVVTGDLKLASASEPQVLAPDLASVLAGVRYFTAGSTHEGEETAALSALEACERAGQAIALVIAPRQLARVHAVALEMSKSGRRVLLRTALAGAAPLAAGDILLLDTLGELPAVYGESAVAFVGGTLAPKGGHNLLEPLAVGCPVLFGPRIENVRDAAALLQGSGAGRQVASAVELAADVASVLRDPGSWRDAVARGRADLALHADAGARSADLVARVLLQSGPPGEPH